MRLTLLCLILALLAPYAAALAQDDDDPDHVDSRTHVYVTTQDFSSLRAGPGMGFERLAVVPPAVTLQAVGRSANARWIQVIYEGQTGWIAYWLLVWTGDLISLPVDGVNPVPFVRRFGVTGITTRETRIYARQVTPSDQVGTIPEGVQVEVVGRLGEGGFFWLQIRYEGQLYWCGSWDIRIIEGSYRTVLDTSYLFAYGRLLAQIEGDISRISNRLGSIEVIWIELAEGRSVSCDFVPQRIVRRTSDADLTREPIFAPVVRALDAGIADINAAISAFEDACNRTEPFVTQSEVRAALERLDSARRNLTLAASLLISLDARNPLLQTND